MYCVLFKMTTVQTPKIFSSRLTTWCSLKSYFFLNFIFYELSLYSRFDRSQRQTYGLANIWKFSSLSKTPDFASFQDLPTECCCCQLELFYLVNSRKRQTLNWQVINLSSMKLSILLWKYFLRVRFFTNDRVFDWLNFPVL